MGEKWYTQIAWAEFNKDIIYLKAKHIWINSKEWDIILGLARIESCHYPWSKQEQPHCPIGQGWTNMEPQSEHPSLTPFPPWWRLSLVWLKWSEWERKKKKKSRGGDHRDNGVKRCRALYAFKDWLLLWMRWKSTREFKQRREMI